MNKTQSSKKLDWSSNNKAPLRGALFHRRRLILLLIDPRIS